MTGNRIPTDPWTRFWLAIIVLQNVVIGIAGLIVLAVALAACSDLESRRAADGYVFGKAEWDRPAIDVRFVLHKSQRQLAAAFPGTQTTNIELKAWSTISLEANRCTVHIVDPSVSYQPEWIGHEIAHCLKGNWHARGEAGQR